MGARKSCGTAISGAFSRALRAAHVLNSQFEEDKVPLSGPVDAGWVVEGVRLLRQVRVALGTGYNVVVTEPWWGEAPL